MDIAKGQPHETSKSVRFPALERLRLETGDLDLLERQGFVSREQCGPHIRLKLRFRRATQQIVRVIHDAGEAAAVIEELHELQRARRLRRRLAELKRETVCLRRESKKSLEPVLATYGFRFHGRQVRRPRRSIAETRPLIVKEN